MFNYEGRLSHHLTEEKLEGEYKLFWREIPSASNEAYKKELFDTERDYELHEMLPEKQNLVTQSEIEFHMVNGVMSPKITVIPLINVKVDKVE